MKNYPQETLATQPIGYWSTETSRLVLARIRAELALDDLTQPHWWTLNHVAGTPGTWTRAALIERLAPFDNLGVDFEKMHDDLLARGLLREDAGTLHVTESGEATRLRAKDRLDAAHEQIHAGIDPADYVAALNVLRRMIANLDGNPDLP
ncbi:MarR family transcriptional regulator [Longispora sp. NPDC051575]|uniref:MarR family transcriptional regulator n=1 Tax=Longispora sp. NPDC051575 TaxID=3154943 RepID=UPI0034332B1D